MERIHGIEEAVRVLRPHWNEFNQFFEQENEKFVKLLRADHTTFGRIVKCHLISEIYLDRYLMCKLSAPRLSDARLSYFQKVMLLPEREAPTTILRPGLLRLNKIRNTFAHDLHAEISIDELLPMHDLLNIFGYRTDDMDVIATIEAFTSTACTWLIVSPQHFEELFAKAFRNVVLRPRDERTD